MPINLYLASQVVVYLPSSLPVSTTTTAAGECPLLCSVLLPFE